MYMGQNFISVVGYICVGIVCVGMYVHMPAMKTAVEVELSCARF